MKKQLLAILPIALLFPLAGCAPKDEGPKGPYNEVIQRALEAIDTPYAWGAAGPDAYCSDGLVCYCLTGEHRIFATSYSMMDWPKVNNPYPGIVCVNINNCGIYMGNGTMIHAGTYGQSVQYASVEADMIYVDYFLKK